MIQGNIAIKYQILRTDFEDYVKNFFVTDSLASGHGEMAEIVPINFWPRCLLCIFMKKKLQLHEKPHIVIRDVMAGATGAPVVAPKFSDALTLYQPGGGADSALPSQRSHHKFPRGYISDLCQLIFL